MIQMSKFTWEHLKKGCCYVNTLAKCSNISWFPLPYFISACMAFLMYVFSDPWGESSEKRRPSKHTKKKRVRCKPKNIGVEHIHHWGIFNMKWTALKCWFWLEPYLYTSLPLSIRMQPYLVKGFCSLCGLFILPWLQSLQVKIPMIAKLLTVESGNKAIILIPVHYWRGRSQWNDGIKMVSELLEQLQTGGNSHCLMKKSLLHFMPNNEIQSNSQRRRWNLRWLWSAF